MNLYTFIRVNMVTNQHINSSTLYDGGLIRGNTARGWLFVGFVLGFASVFAAVWIYLRDFGPSDKDKGKIFLKALFTNYLTSILQET